MPKRPILTIDVDDRNFKNFLELFQKYQDEVANLPGKWTQFDHAVTSTGGQYSQLAALLMTQTQLISQALGQHEKLSAAVHGAGSGMHYLAGETKNVATYLLAATTTLAKWATAGGLIGGLLGLGGLWGLERLSQFAGQSRRSAAGLGVTSSEQQAFETNYNRFFDPSGVLSNVAESKSDYNRRFAFYAMGLNPEQVQSMDPAQLAAELAPRAKKMFLAGDQSEQQAQATGLLNFFTMEDLRRLSKTPDEELETARTRYERDRVGFQVPDGVQRRWQDFNDQLDRASKKIADVFVTDLAPLEPGLEKLSAAVADIVDSLMKNPDLKKWLADVGDGLGTMAKWIGGPDFKKDVEEFAHEVGELASGLRRLLGGIIEVTDWLRGKAPSSKDDLGFGDSDGGAVPGAGKEAGDNWNRFTGWLTGTAFNPWHTQNVVATSLVGSGLWNQSQAAGLMGMLASENSNFDPNLHNPAGGGRGAWGIAQWRGSRLDDFKNFAGYDIADEKVDAEKKLADELRFLNYELSQGSEKDTGRRLRALQDPRDVAEQGERLYERPDADVIESQVAKARRKAQAYQRDVTVNIHNATGGSAVVTTNQTANQQ